MFCITAITTLNQLQRVKHYAMTQEFLKMLSPSPPYDWLVGYDEVDSDQEYTPQIWIVKFYRQCIRNFLLVYFYIITF